jgi:hypothetical protein
MSAYDIFRGSYGKDGEWLECVDGFATACAKMRTYSEQTPGAYFVFWLDAAKVVASVDTSDKRKQTD